MNGGRSRWSTAAAQTAAGGILMAALCGCTPPEPGAAATAAATRPTAAERHAAAGVDPRDQYALLDAVLAAKGAQQDEPGVLSRVRGAWIDRRFRWEARLQPALCGPAGDCVVLPFDHATRQEPITQGWLPRLALAPPERQALTERCAAHAQCVVQFEGTLSQFELSTELPTSLTFSNVTVVGTREAAPGESWTVSKRRARLSERIAAAAAPAADP